MIADQLRALGSIIATGSLIFMGCVGAILGVRSWMKKTNFRPAVLLLAFATHFLFSVLTIAGALAWQTHARALDRAQCEEHNRTALARGDAEVFGCDFADAGSDDVGLIAYVGMTTILAAVLCRFYVNRFESAGS